MKNLKISKKLIISFGMILLLFVISVIVVAFSLNGIKVQLGSFYTGPWETRAISTDISNYLSEQQKYLFKAIATTEESIITPSLAEVENYSQKIQESMNLLKQKVQPENLEKVQNLEAKVNEWNTILEEVLKLTADITITSNQISLYMEENTVGILKEVTAAVNEIVAATNELGDVLITETDSAQFTTTLLLVIMCLFSVVAGICLCAYITKSITSPLMEIETAADQMAEGHLDVSVHYTSKDELGNLSKSIRTMSEKISYYMTELSGIMKQLASGDLNVKKCEAFLGDFAPVQQSIYTLTEYLNGTMTQINQSADQVASGSEQVASGSQALSQGATQQASSVEELAATINEISLQIQNSAQNASNASAKASSVGEEMTASNTQMQHMIQAMSDISISSNEIGKIIKTIEDIAFQTNILALNAAVEAARAGSAGKGFAVVADEVRNLASKSAEASKNTSSLIETSLKAVESGTKIADETAKSLLLAVEGAREVAITVDKISEAAREQADSISQVTQGVDQISSVVQTNSATAEESAAASEELSGQSQMLKHLVGRFQLQNDNDTQYVEQSPTSVPSQMYVTQQPVQTMDLSKY